MEEGIFEVGVKVSMIWLMACILIKQDVLVAGIYIYTVQPNLDVTYYRAKLMKD